MRTAPKTATCSADPWFETDRGNGTHSVLAMAEKADRPAPVAVKSQPDQVPTGTVLPELKYRAILNAVSDWVFIIRKDGTLIEFHGPGTGAGETARLGGTEIIGKRLTELLPVQLVQQARYYLEKTLRSPQPLTFTCQYGLLGKLCDFHVRMAVCGPGEVLALVRDVTDRQSLEKEILEISNREQQRIGQDLHDGLGQHLTGITFLARALENRLTALGLPEAEEAREIGKLVLQALSQTRNLARGLFPVELEQKGLIPALKGLAATVEKLFQVSCRFDADETAQIGSRTVAHHLFRITQEAISNSVRHGKAKHLTIRLQPHEDRFVLSVQDDGSGFAPHGVTKGLGLRIMHYRAQKIGATLDIGPAPRGGALVTCAFRDTAEEALPGNPR